MDKNPCPKKNVVCKKIDVPNKGLSPAEKQRVNSSLSDWAKTDSGYDVLKSLPLPPPKPGETRLDRLRRAGIEVRIGDMPDRFGRARSEEGYSVVLLRQDVLDGLKKGAPKGKREAAISIVAHEFTHVLDERTFTKDGKSIYGNSGILEEVNATLTQIHTYEELKLQRKPKDRKNLCADQSELCQRTRFLAGVWEGKFEGKFTNPDILDDIKDVGDEKNAGFQYRHAVLSQVLRDYESLKNADEKKEYTDEEAAAQVAFWRRVEAKDDECQGEVAGLKK